MSNDQSHQGNRHDDLARLASICGIDLDWWDSLGTHHHVSEHSLRHLLHGLGALGKQDASDADIHAAIASESLASWRRCVPMVRVLYHEEAYGVELVVNETALNDTWHWQLHLEDGKQLSGSVQPHTLGMAGAEGGGGGESRAEVDGHRLELRWLTLPPLAIGYHRLEVEPGTAGPACSVHLLVTPRRCHSSPDNARCWGLSVQLYALHSGNSAGTGDFGDLGIALDTVGALGADVLGVNPLHALFAHAPEDASPYCPSSRVFLNPLYLSLADVPGYALLDTATRDLDLPPRDTELVDYTAAAHYKHRLLEAIFEQFDTAPACAEHRANFSAWRRAIGDPLERFATFEMLRELDAKDSSLSTGDWRRWPPEWQDPLSATVSNLATQHQARVRYHAWLQWAAATQLEAAAEHGKALGLAIGLYRDLAVGIAANGADAWVDRAVYVQGAHVGAPPDEFSVNGQDWGLPPMNPRELRSRGYAPFRAMLRANMTAAGALRIDHVMGLARLFWIPADGSPTDGSYVASNLDEMLAVLAIESQRAQCVIIGEDLGTVPEGFRERLFDAGVLSYRLMYFEKHYDSDRRFRRPQEYSAQSLVGANTHDLPTLTGFWHDTDISLRAELNLFPSEDLHQQQQHERVADRYRLLAALADEGLLPDGIDPQQPERVQMNKPLIDAIHQYLARTPSALLVLNIEDILGEGQQMNLPGTDRDRYPNWRRRAALSVDQWASDERFTTTAELMRRERP